MPTVSVLIPTWQPQPEHLRAAIESVCAQNFSDWELIIHDDASKTDVQAIVEPYIDPPHIRCIQSDRNRGIGGNWNQTLAFSTGTYVAYLFQDDLWHPDYLERAVEILEKHPDVGFVALQHDYLMQGSTDAAATGIYEEVMDARRRLPEGRIDRHTFLQEWIERGLRPNIIGEPSFVVLRRSVMDRAGLFLEDMSQGLDAEYWTRCLLLADGWWIAEPLGQFRVHHAAATAQNEESGKGRMDRLRTFGLLIKRLPPGELRNLAKSIRRKELLGMVKKFFRR